MNNGNYGEKRFFIIFLSLLAIVIILPYLYGYFICPANKFYMWLLGLNGSDCCFYLAWGPKQAANGYWLFEDKLNGFAERRAVFNPFWLIMGRTASLFNVPVVIIHHFQRVFFSLLLMLLIYRISKDYFDKFSWRISVLLLAAFSSGFYLHSAEANLFLTMLGEVNLPVAALLLLLCIFFGYRTFFKNENKALTTGLLALLMATVYPYAIISFYLIFLAAAIFQVVRGRAFKQVLSAYLKFFLIPLPVVLYDGYLVLSDQRLTEGQAFFSSPDPIGYFMTLGIICLFSIAGTYFIIRQRKEQFYFPVIWAAVNILQTYLPLSIMPFQVQLILGVQVPLALLAIYGIREIYFLIKARFALQPRLSKLAVSLYFLFIILLASPYNILQYFRSFTDMKNFNPPSYLDMDDKEAMDWLTMNTDDNEQVISATRIAPYIPVVADNRMYCSDYYAPTANFFQKEKEIRWLFDKDSVKTDDEILDFLSRNKIDYIYYNKYLFELGGEEMKSRLLHLPGFNLSFDNGTVSIIKFEYQDK